MGDDPYTCFNTNFKWCLLKVKRVIIIIDLQTSMFGSLSEIHINWSLSEAHTSTAQSQTFALKQKLIINDWFICIDFL